MSELIQKLDQSAYEALYEEAMEAGIITEDEFNWGGASYGEEVEYLRGTPEDHPHYWARKNLASRLEIADRLWYMEPGEEFSAEEIRFLCEEDDDEEDLLDLLSRENCEVTGEITLEGLTEWVASIARGVRGKEIYIAAVFYTDDDDRKQANEDGWDSINWENRFSHYTITEP